MSHKIIKPEGIELIEYLNMTKNIIEGRSMLRHRLFLFGE